LYTEQKNSASVFAESADDSNSSNDYDTGISIETVDGLTVGNPLTYWRLMPLAGYRPDGTLNKQVWLCPGKHTLALMVENCNSTSTEHYDPNPDVGNYTDTSGTLFIAKGTATAEFVANHQYRLTASFSGDPHSGTNCKVMLRDEADEDDLVGAWEFTCRVSHF
jgi:hypothetical protein